jgi:hypothetical protein
MAAGESNLPVFRKSVSGTNRVGCVGMLSAELITRLTQSLHAGLTQFESSEWQERPKRKGCVGRRRSKQMIHLG